MTRLTPGVDTDLFRPETDGTAVRERYGLVGRPVIVCVSRLVRRKGQDVLIDALPAVRRALPEAMLLLVGTGPYEPALRARVERAGLRDAVVFTGGVPFAQLPSHYAAGDVFAMPCRTRRGGLDVEGLGIVYLEASAVGLPVLAGDSGGAPEAVREGETGYVVGGADVEAVTERLVRLLRDEPLRRELGSAGREWVVQKWRWDVLAAQLTDLLQS